jgi:hypothetical protein
MTPFLLHVYPVGRSRFPILTLALALGLAFTAATGLATAPLCAQETAASLEGLTDADARASVRALITSFAAKGLPTAPLVTKVREGLAKGATADRIRSATALLAQRLESAATALAPARGPEELSAGADALQAGIPTATLRDMRRIWPVKPLTVPLGVLSEMVASGVPQANATRRVRELLMKGATSTQLAALGLNVRADVEAGLAPDAAMELRSKGVLSLLVPLPANTTIAAPPRRPHDPPRR